MQKLIAFAAAGLIAAGSAHAATTFTATLTGGQEVPPSGSQFVATANLELVDTNGDDILDALNMTVEIPSAFDFSATDAGIDGNDGSQVVTVFHIHSAPRGVNGPVAFGIIGPNSDTDMDRMFTLNDDGSVTHSNQWDLGEGNGTTLAAFLPALLAAAPGEDVGLYFNLHTEEFRGGELRGQLVATPIPGALPLFAGIAAAFGFARRRMSR
ncbi:CHRD domain-containing protein [Parvularcula sp. ZS-1/3]|uniref:CHRD domain-containing protein n=1 Tax=Parvularcula mediterranea TaxID=2732508 RepID=A0A7Y3RLA7_9PROT|nr:CHRD domain-containing protein [Parvularcula mediterranea]NNU16186.1 CHRD domain-containing protein [Parvularcula mediterranea]